MNKKRKLISNSQLLIPNLQLNRNGLAPLEISRPWASVKSLMGFSFMELMVVVAIIGILIAASMPVFRSFARGRNLKEGANMVMSALRKSREAAITYRKNYKTVLDTLNQAVAIYEDDNVDNPAENWAKLPDFVEFDATNFSSNVSNFPPPPSSPSTTLYYLEFKPNGGCTINGHIELLEESTSDTRRIYFTLLTGRIRIE